MAKQTSPLPEQLSALDRRIDDLVDEHDGTVSVWYGDLAGAASYTRDPDAQHYAASTMKLPLAVAAYRRAERGELDLDASVPVHNAFPSAAGASAFGLDQHDDQDDETWSRIGGRATVRELVRQSIVRSGNLATNLVWEQVGADEVARVLADAGCSGRTVVARGIEDAEARERGIDNLVTAADLALVVRGIADRTLAGAATCADLERVLAAQEHRDMIPAGLPPGTYVANKTGWVDGVAHDVALVRPEAAKPYVLAVCTTLDVPEATANALIGAVSRAIWETRAP